MDIPTPVTITLLFLGSYLIGSINGAKLITNVPLLAAFFGAQQDISKLGSGGEMGIRGEG